MTQRLPCRKDLQGVHSYVLYTATFRSTSIKRSSTIYLVIFRTLTFSSHFGQKKKLARAKTSEEISSLAVKSLFFVAEIFRLFENFKFLHYVKI